MQGIDSKVTVHHLVIKSGVLPVKQAQPWSDGAGAGVVFVSPQRQVLPYAFTLGKKCSNNVIEYQALIISLQMTLELRIPSLVVSGDSKLVINQLLKDYEVKKEDLVPYFYYANI
ncbi:hypothetical protein RJ639_005648 [Escallonia herrerae]|uniref:RNase H type-1 domain-containing protein n=1 Tax=Escallonia herrerae TaxID=1293975 RepID=A0AA89AVE3_9ASTE|nr:hypothetical protein RJ639_005648 [Escallonia herrerae]